MNPIFLKGILLALLASISITTYAQSSQKTINTQVSFGRNLSDCRHPGSFCGMQTGTNKANSNSVLSYDKKTNSLIMVLTKTKTTAENLAKLTGNKLEKGFYLYPVTETFVLPQSILQQLNIKGKTSIKKGNYLVKDKGKTYEIVLQLE